MRKRVFCLILLMILVLGILSSVHAHPEQSMHDKDLNSVLLGKDVSLTGEEKEKFQAIANAAALCIDQFSSNEEKRSKRNQKHSSFS